MKLPGLKREELDGNWGKRENPDSHRGIRGEDEDSRKNRLPGGDEPPPRGGTDEKNRADKEED